MKKALLLSAFLISHALWVAHHDFGHEHVHCLTFSSGKGSLRKSDSDTYSSTGSCCTILLTASKRRRLLVAVLLCACCPAAAGLQFQTDCHSSLQLLRSPYNHHTRHRLSQLSKDLMRMMTIMMLLIVFIQHTNNCTLTADAHCYRLVSTLLHRLYL